MVFNNSDEVLLSVNTVISVDSNLNIKSGKETHTILSFSDRIPVTKYKPEFEKYELFFY